jgi:hypothetical protein
VLLTVSATSVVALEDVEAKLAAALPGATIGRGPIQVLTRKLGHRQRLLQQCQSTVQIPGLTGTEVRDTLRSLGPQLAVKVARSVSHGPVEAVGYFTDGAIDWFGGPPEDS